MEPECVEALGVKRNFSRMVSPTKANVIHSACSKNMPVMLEIQGPSLLHSCSSVFDASTLHLIMLNDLSSQNLMKTA